MGRCTRPPTACSGPKSRTRPPIAILPAGTGNDFAKLAGTAGLDPAEAVSRLARGRVRMLDVGHAWDEYFLNSVGIGFDAEVAAEVARGGALTGIPAYLIAVTRVLRGFISPTLSCRSAEASFTDRFLLIEIGVGPVVGGGFRITPHAKPDDGVFDVCAIRHQTKLGILTKLPLAMFGWHTRLAAVRSFRTARLDISRVDGTAPGPDGRRAARAPVRDDHHPQAARPSGAGRPDESCRAPSPATTTPAFTPRSWPPSPRPMRGMCASYGHDPLTAQAEALFREHFGPAARAFFVFNGTAANVVGLQVVTRPHHAVICAESAHIHVDECGAPERFTGCKLVTLPTADGKLRPEELERLLHGVGDEHRVQPRVVSITQATELGTVYRPEEIRALADWAHGRGMLLHLDGARICNAAVALGLPFRAFTTDAGVDLLSFGGTKIGLLGAEAVVFLGEPATADDALGPQAGHAARQQDALPLRAVPRPAGHRPLAAERRAGQPDGRASRPSGFAASPVSRSPSR